MTLLASPKRLEMHDRSRDGLPGSALFKLDFRPYFDKRPATVR